MSADDEVDKWPADYDSSEVHLTWTKQKNQKAYEKDFKDKKPIKGK